MSGSARHRSGLIAHPARVWPTKVGPPWHSIQQRPWHSIEQRVDIQETARTASIIASAQVALMMVDPAGRSDLGRFQSSGSGE